MGLRKGPAEGGSGGKRGHSNMEHWGYTDEVKDTARKRRRLEGKRIAEEEKQNLHEDENSRSHEWQNSNGSHPAG